MTDDDDFGMQRKTSRKKTIVQERASKSNTFHLSQIAPMFNRANDMYRSTVYRGFEGYQLFLEAYQLVLWKQCFALTEDKGLPSELEVGKFLFIFLIGSLL